MGIVNGKQQIVENAVVYKDVTLDKLVVTGPRGGVTTLWRPAANRRHQVALWSNTREQAVK